MPIHRSLSLLERKYREYAASFEQYEKLFDHFPQLVRLVCASNVVSLLNCSSMCLSITMQLLQNTLNSLVWIQFELREHYRQRDEDYHSKHPEKEVPKKPSYAEKYIAEFLPSPEQEYALNTVHINAYEFYTKWLDDVGKVCIQYNVGSRLACPRCLTQLSCQQVRDTKRY